jgi:hypothetical protein
MWPGVIDVVVPIDVKYIKTFQNNYFSKN